MQTDHRSRPWRIAHLCTSDIAGGAARSAYRIHHSLLGLGIDSRLYVRRKFSDDPTVHVIRWQTEADHAVYGSELGRLAVWREKWLDALKTHAQSLFSLDGSPEGPPVLRALADADIVQLHWVGQEFLDYRRAFAPDGIKVPVVWRLSDTNPFTGGCHFTAGCERFTTGCGHCPQLGSHMEDDLSRQVFLRRYRALGPWPGRLHYVAPTRWMADQVGRSLMGRDRSRSVIHNAVDTDLFRPGDSIAARQRLGLPPTGPLLLFVAERVDSPRKGLAVLEAALERMTGPAPHLVIAGRFNDKGRSLACRSLLGPVPAEHMPDLYRAVDLVAVPSLEDNLPNVVFEALASGRPLIASAVGGIPDLVGPDSGGELVPPGDASALAQALERGLAGLADGTRAHLARSLAEQRLALTVEAEAFRSLYARLLSERSHDPV